MNTPFTNKTLWDSVLDEVEGSISKPNFTTWFKDTFIVKRDGGSVYVGVPNTFVKQWLSQKFNQDIIKHLRELDGTVRSVEYMIAQPKNIKPPSKQKGDVSSSESLPLEEHSISKEDNLNPRYTFDNFVIGPFNELAHAASQAIIKQPGVVYNPLFIYGNTGHGKTHLTQAIGNQIKQLYKNKNIYYMTSEQYTDEYVRAVQTNKVSTFKEKYRKYDVLIIDDIQFLSKKEKTQEELFHLFNTLYENNKQIIFSSDKHPNFIPNLEDRLKSRFNQGMIVDIPRPDTEARIAIIQNKIAIQDLELDRETIAYLAEHIETNIRELEGVLNTINCQTQLKQRSLTLPEVKKLVKGDNRPKKTLSAEELIKIIADFYNIEAELISGKTRKKEIVRPRQISMYIMREHYKASYPTIGEKLGGRDHTTVIHSCDKIRRELREDQLLVQQIEQIQSLL